LRSRPVYIAYIRELPPPVVAGFNRVIGTLVKLVGVA